METISNRCLCRELGLALLLLSGCALETPATDEVVASKEAVSWTDFPVVMTNLTPEDLPGLSGVIDVAAYYTPFIPYSQPAPSSYPGTPAQYQAFVTSEHKKALGYDRASALLDAAATAGMKVFVMLPWMAAAEIADPAKPSKPELNGAGTRACGAKACTLTVQDPALGSVSIPVGAETKDKDAITASYVEYHRRALVDFVAQLTQHPKFSSVYGWYGFEEVRPWAGQDLNIALTMRQVLDANAATQNHPLSSYSPLHYQPEHLTESLIFRYNSNHTSGPRQAIASQFPFKPAPAKPLAFALKATTPAGCFLTDPEKPCTFNGLAPYYTASYPYGLDAAGKLYQFYDHLMYGAHASRKLKAYGHTNRLYGLHRAELSRQVTDIVRAVYQARGETAPPLRRFHVPDLTDIGARDGKPTSEEARHDFWVGLHEAEGIFLSNYAYVRQARGAMPPAGSVELLKVWTEYEAGLKLIRSTLRDYLVSGVRTRLTPQLTANKTTIPGTDYITQTLVPSIRTAEMAMPDYVPLTATLLKIGKNAVLIVTNSYNQSASYSLPLGTTIAGVEVKSGTAGAPTFSGAILSDSMSGIDARVYLIKFP